MQNPNNEQLMTLEEGIEHCICLSYKNEYKQFAEWLKELKEYRDRHYCKSFSCGMSFDGERTYDTN